MFVRGGVPGDHLRVTVTEARGRFGRGVIQEVLQASPDRVEPPCPYFGRCGGCRLQQIAYPAQLAFKERQVRECLTRLGGLPPFELRPIVPAPEPLGYRNKMEFTVAGPGPSSGCTSAERYDLVLDIERCLLQSETMNTLLDELRRQVRARGAVGVGSADRARPAALRDPARGPDAPARPWSTSWPSSPDVAMLMPVAEALRERVPATASVLLNVNAKKASVAVGSEEHLLLGRDHITESLSGVALRGLGQLVLPDEHPAGRAPVRAGGRGLRARRQRDAHGPLLRHRRHQSCCWRGGSATCTASSWRKPRWPTPSATRAPTASTTARSSPGEVRHVLPTLMRDGAPPRAAARMQRPKPPAYAAAVTRDPAGLRRRQLLRGNVALELPARLCPLRRPVLRRQRQGPGGAAGRAADRRASRTSTRGS